MNPQGDPVAPLGRPGPDSTTRALAAFRGWRAMRHRNYRLFFGGQVISLVGTWMQQVAQGWLVLQLTGDPFALGLVAAAQFTPVLVLGLFGGIVADHLPKRRTLILTQISSAALALVLFALTATGRVEVWHVIVLAALLGAVNAVDMPTRQAFAVEMVGRDDVANAVGLNSAMFNASRIVGPALAGLTIGAFDISIAFLLNGLSYLAAIVGYFLMREEDLRSAPRIDRPVSVGAVLESLVEGLSYVRRTPIVLLAVTVLGLVATFGMNFSVLVPALAQDVLRSDAAGYGFLMSASGLGSLVAALGIAFMARPRTAAIAWGAIVLASAEIVLALSRSFPVSMLAMLAVGFGAIAMAATVNTAIQLTVPDHLRGRVMSVYTTIFAGSTPIGGLLLGAVASRFGVAEALLIGGVVSLLVGLAAVIWLRAIRATPVLRPAVRAASADPTGLTTVRPR